MSDTLATRPLDQQPNVPKRSSPVGFMLRLANALHLYGMTAYELEGIMEKVGDALGYDVQCLSHPTNIIMSFSDSDEPEPTTYVFRVHPGEINLEKQLLVTNIVNAVVSGSMSTEDGAAGLKAVIKQPQRYAGLILVLSYGLISSGISRVLGAALNEILVALVIGIITGLISLPASRSAAGKQLFPTLAALMAALFSTFLAHFNIIQSPYITTLAGVIVLVPGLLLTTAIAELSSQHMVSGTSRLFSAGIIFLQIGFGVALGNSIANRFFPFSVPELSGANLPLWTNILAISVACIGLFFLFQARLKDMPWVILAGVIAYSSTLMGAQFMGPIVGALMGAFVTGLAANFFERITKTSRSVMLLPGIILLVPGSIGFQSLSFLVAHDVVAGLDTAFTMVFVGVALVTGLLISTIVVPPTAPSIVTARA